MWSDVTMENIGSVTYHTQKLPTWQTYRLAWCKWNTSSEMMSSRIEYHPLGCTIYSTSKMIKCCLFTIGRLHKSRDIWVEAEVDSLIVIPGDSLGKFILFICTTLGSVYLQFLVFKGEHFHQWTQQKSHWTWDCNCHLVTRAMCYVTGEKRVTLLPGVIDPDNQVEVRMLGIHRNVYFVAKWSMEHLLVLPGPRDKCYSKSLRRGWKPGTLTFEQWGSKSPYHVSYLDKWRCKLRMMII